jgi:hypothetical protein
LESVAGKTLRAAGATGRWLRGIDDDWRRDHHTAPLPLLRWLAALAIAIWYWVKTGTPQSATAWADTWLPAVVIILVLVLPDAASVTFGGLKLEMRRTQEDVAALRQQITLMSVQTQRQRLDVNVINNPAVAGVAAAGAAAEVAESETTEDESLAAVDRFLEVQDVAVDPMPPEDVPS